MQFTDLLYGPVSVDDPLIEELYHSPPLQRLKGIGQGMFSSPSRLLPTVTRYDHSVGVMLLLRRLGASRKEQVTGLLHDISHTAFSHVADFLFPNEEHTFHETLFSQIVLNSDVPSILLRHGLSVDDILNTNHFSLLEQPIPHLCADRIDYSLRDLTRLRSGTSFLPYLTSLTTHADRIVFKDAETALSYARDYLELDRSAWASPLEVATYLFLSRIL